jgi:hypothetical protein
MGHHPVMDTVSSGKVPGYSFPSHGRPVGFNSQFIHTARSVAWKHPSLGDLYRGIEARRADLTTSNLTFTIQHRAGYRGTEIPCTEFA